MGSSADNPSTFLYFLSCIKYFLDSEDCGIAMSWTLAKRGLELFEDELSSTGTTKKNKDLSGNSKFGKSTLKQGVQRAAKQKKRTIQKKKQERQHLIKKKVPNALKQYERLAPRDQTEDN